MNKLTGQNDELFAAGLAIGSAASLLGSTTVTITEFIAAKLGSLGAMKIGIELGLAINPFFACVTLIGGVGYLVYKACK